MRRRAWTIGTTALVLGGMMWAAHQSGVLSTLTGTRLSAVRSWGYQLQNLDKTFDALAASDTDLLVVDFSMSQPAGRPMKPLDPADVERLKNKPGGGRRIVLAYFSIGEAEEYRFYWNAAWKTSPPSWLIAENCRWPRNHLVRFWEDGWKDIMIRGDGSYLARIQAAGFDGVYLDRVDVYDDIKDRHPKARADMIAFVGELAREARRNHPGFLVVAQNAEDLLESPTYRAAIDGLGKEDMLYGVQGTGKRNPPEMIAWSRERIDKLKRDGKKILVAEYLTSQDQIAVASKELATFGYVAVYPPRALDGSDALKSAPSAERSKEYGTPEYATQNCDGVWKKGS